MFLHPKRQRHYVSRNSCSIAYSKALLLFLYSAYISAEVDILCRSYFHAVCQFDIRIRASCLKMAFWHRIKTYQTLNFAFFFTIAQTAKQNHFILSFVKWKRIAMQNGDKSRYFFRRFSLVQSKMCRSL